MGLVRGLIHPLGAEGDLRAGRHPGLGPIAGAGEGGGDALGFAGAQIQLPGLLHQGSAGLLVHEVHLHDDALAGFVGEIHEPGAEEPVLVREIGEIVGPGIDEEDPEKHAPGGALEPIEDLRALVPGQIADGEGGPYAAAVGSIGMHEHRGRRAAPFTGFGGGIEQGKPAPGAALVKAGGFRAGM